LDIWTKEKRSDVMSRIGQQDTKPEILVRKLLHALGYRFRLHRRDLPGRPDIVLPKYKTVIFVHGCFWHLHADCPEGRIPDSNMDYWEPKLKRTVARDVENCRALQDLGWNVVTVWECQIEKDPESVAGHLIEVLQI